VADLSQQAAIGDDQTFIKRVRQALVARARLERRKPLGETTPARRLMALAILQNTTQWAEQVARSLAADTDGASITTAAAITDAQIKQFLEAAISDYAD